MEVKLNIQLLSLLIPLLEVISFLKKPCLFKIRAPLQSLETLLIFILMTLIRFYMNLTSLSKTFKGNLL